MAGDGVDLPELEEAPVDAAQQGAIAAHLQQVRSARYLRGFQKKHDPDPPVRTRTRDLITGSKQRSGAQLQDAQEVGDDFFAQPADDARKGFVKLSVSAASNRVKRFSMMVKRDSTEVERGAVPASVRRKQTAPPLLVVEEEGGDQSQPIPFSELVLNDEDTPPIHSPMYSHLSLNESPANSSEDSLSSITDSSRPPTPRGPLLNLPTASMHAHPHAQSTEPSVRRLHSRTASLAPSFVVDTDLSRPPSRTLTLDETLPKPKRRDSRSDFSPAKLKLSKGSIRPHDLQRILARRRRRIGKGDAQTEQLLDQQLEEALLKAGALAEQEQEKYDVDVLWENQRGLIVFGFPRFSSAALAQFDPAPWSDAALKDSPYTPQTHPLENPFWEWDHTCWMVDMSLDADENGWQYSTRFSSSHWRGEADLWRSFVRRRRWIRGRFYRPHSTHPSNPAATTLALQSRHIDWSAGLDPSLSLSTPDSNSDTHIPSLKAATALLPLTAAHKTHIFCWEQAFDAQAPFLPWATIKTYGFNALLERQASDFAGRSDAELVGLWRDAVGVINFHRVGRVMRLCRVDREKLGVWKWWLGEEVGRESELTDHGGGDKGVLEDGEGKESGGPEEVKEKEELEKHVIGLVRGGFDPRQWSNEGNHPEVEDVWDVIENHLDAILKQFEFQLTRVYFLRLILARHPLSDTQHRYINYDALPCVDSPDALSPSMQGRLDFYRDVKELQASLSGGLEDESAPQKREETMGDVKSRLTVKRMAATKKGKGKA